MLLCSTYTKNNATLHAHNNCNPQRLTQSHRTLQPILQKVPRSNALFSIIVLSPCRQEARYASNDGKGVLFRGTMAAGVTWRNRWCFMGFFTKSVDVWIVSFRVDEDVKDVLVSSWIILWNSRKIVGLKLSDVKLNFWNEIMKIVTILIEKKK